MKNPKDYRRYFDSKFLRIMCILALAMIIVLLPAGSAQAKVRLNKKTATMVVGSKLKLKVKGTKKKVKVKWKSSNKKVATVTKKGVVKAKKPGRTTITARIKGKGINVTRKVKIKVISKNTYYLNNKKKLYNYIVKHGKYDKTREVYYLTKVVEKAEDEDGAVVTAEIEAYKNSKALRFCVTLASDTPDDFYQVSMTMNYNQLKPGVLLYHGLPMDYSPEGLELDGILYYTYDGNNAGISWTHERDYDEDNMLVSETDTVDPSYVARGNRLIGKGFKGWNAIAKKAGLSMKGIGFTRYK